MRRLDPLSEVMQAGPRVRSPATEYRSIVSTIEQQDHPISCAAPPESFGRCGFWLISF